MARNPESDGGEPGLFDFSFKKEPAAEEPAPKPAPGDAGGEERTLPLFEGAGLPPVVEQVEAETEQPASGEPGAPATASPTLRLQAGLVDLGLILAVGLLALLGLAALGVRPQAADWPAWAVFLLAFSFLYHALPLAFWGRTPGMARIGLRAHGGDDPQLTFGQTVRRWAGAVLTVAGLGLPLLISLTGASLSDRMSASRTVVER